MHRVAFVSLLTLVFGACSTADSVQGRLSAVVTFSIEGDAVAKWLKNPGLAFVEAHVLFPPQLADSVMFGVDHEMTEGVEDPVHFEGADWMALIGVQRTGMVWVAAGTAEQLEGTASTDRKWQKLSLDAALQPDTWYRLRCVADFGNRRFVRFTVEGPGIDTTLDLSEHSLDYPNYLPFDGRALTHYVWSMHMAPLGGTPEDCATVYFDDVRYGLLETETTSDGAIQFKEKVIASCDFEGETGPFDAQPLDMADIMKTKKIALKNYVEGKWYTERDTARARVMKAPFARSGHNVVECDATLRNISYEDWLEERNDESVVKPES